MHLLRKTLRPFWRPLYRTYSKVKTKMNTFDVPLEKLLRGGDNGIRAAKYAELMGEFLRPSTSVFEGPQLKLLRQFDEIGEKIFEKETLESTEYYKNAAKCMRLTGSFFYDHPEKIEILMRRFIAQYKGKRLDFPLQPGQSEPNQPIWLRPVRDSSYFEVIDGNHRIALAIMTGKKTLPAILYEKEAAYTPLQQLLLDGLWINKNKWLYQPVDSLELKEKWILVRKCTDRMEWMKNFLHKYSIDSSSPTTYIDIGSCYGWFVKKFEELGFEAYGMDRDPFGIEIGFKVYGLKQSQVIHSDIGLGLKELVKNKKKFDVVSCLSVLHHFVLGKTSMGSEELIKLLDNITGKVLFIDTGEEHETAFGGLLKGWSPEFIQKWILSHTHFKKVIPLGVDEDRKPPFQGYYNRTLFACVK